MISRREFLTLAAKLASISGGVGLVLSDPFWKFFGEGGDSVSAAVPSPLDEIIASAPPARYWTSAPTTLLLSSP